MRWDNLTYPSLTQRQRDYVLGAVLGDDSLSMDSNRRHAYLRTSQSLAHEAYLRWKYRIMKEFTLASPKLITSKRYGRVHPAIRFHTRATPELTALYHLCYPKGRKAVSERWLSQLTPFSLAVWYMDDGTYAPGRHFCMLYTGAFPCAQQRLIQRYLKERWGITNLVIQRNRRQWCLRFPRLGTQQFLQIIEPYVRKIPSMHYKLGYPEKSWMQPVQESMNGWLHAWRRGEDDIMRQWYGHIQGQRLARRLRRSLNAVYLRAQKLGLNGRQVNRVSDGHATYTN